MRLPLIGKRERKTKAVRRLAPMQSGNAASDHRPDSGFRALDVRGTEPDVRAFIFPSGIARRYDGVQRSNGPIPFAGFLTLKDGSERPIWRHVPVVDRAGRIGVLRSGGLIAPGIAPSQLDSWQAAAGTPTIGDGIGVWSGVVKHFRVGGLGSLSDAVN